MIIAHVCLSCFYIDDRSYQENELVKQHIKDGHEVIVIASTHNHDENGKTVYVEPADYIGAEGARIIRLPYRFAFLSHFIASKLRIHKGVYDLLVRLKPDAILFHGTTGWEMLNIARYKREFPKVITYIDAHEYWGNSAKGFVSREILHRRYYGPILRKSHQGFSKILCISTEVMDFVNEVYGIPKDKLEFYPLGGRPIPPDEYKKLRETSRQALKIEKQQILFVQSGKITRKKKLIESLTAFSKETNPDFRFCIIGVLDDTIEAEVMALINADKRVQFLGWKSADEMNAILAAADIYLQPGTQSVTMQNSLCAHCAVILDDVKAHTKYIKENGWLINESQSLENILKEVSTKRDELERMQENSYAIAKSILDYKKLAKRVLS
ncbi:MAG: glycosyltransferase family 4 protein [Hyphomicrobiales bacterium]